MLEKVLKLAEEHEAIAVWHPPGSPQKTFYNDSAAAIRALVEVAKCADRIWYDDSEDNKACLARAIHKLEELNDGLEV